MQNHDFQNTATPMRTTPYALLDVAIDGFIPSIFVIGSVRAWLSLTTGVASVYGTDIISSSELKLAQYITFIVAFFLLAFFRLGPLQNHRRIVALSLGFVGAAAVGFGYLFSSTWIPGTFVTTIIAAIVFVSIIRLWGEDNCTASFKVIVIRLCLSFIAQYIIYAAVLVLPSTFQRGCAIILPALMGICLMKEPHPTIALPPSHPLVTHLPRLKMIPLMAIIGFSIAAHSLLFLFSPAVSGVWILGLLILAITAYPLAVYLKDSQLFKSIVCVTLFVQCFGVILVLAFSSSYDWISFSKSLSYAAGMLLTMCVGCRLGAFMDSSRGRSVSAWLALYFAIFYGVRYLALYLDLGPTVQLTSVAVCLVFAAVLMIGTDWSAVFSDTTEETEPAGLGDKELDMVCKDLSHAGGLTQRESEVLADLIANRSVEQIAESSCVSKSTIRTQIQGIYRKLDIHSREELMALANIRRGVR